MLEDLVRAAANDDWDAVHELEKIAAADPGSLAGHLPMMLDLGVLWPPVLYRAAGDDVVSQVIDRIDSGDASDQLNHLLLILGHTRSQLAAQALRRWETSPPAGSDQLHITALAYALQGGWALSRDGASRDLCSTTAFELTMSPAPASQSPACPWCSSPLWTVLDLDSDLDQVREALVHTGFTGRLRVQTCFLCSCYTTLYSQITSDGGSVWSPHNTAPSYLRRSTEEPPSLLPRVGSRRATPYQADAWHEGGSTLGGHPQWIQDAEHADCTSCGQPMDFVALIGGADLGFGEGAYYVQLHAPCGVAAVCYQQS
ncbi:hypothetical protein Rhe02_16140 [Rhizocola hellebori]|uniref:DUF1963 domain-containing protein n=1 Tax=Rhizocola hellebori TaxID=1392758 RepID=A0A8J3Q582_9ACTN|nr:hypothetical protein [Rhizocola hellebori]GIH03547.1 hypothetical protein Rhe02_16140 [Rhizocola hellebori]